MARPKNAPRKPPRQGSKAPAHVQKPDDFKRPVTPNVPSVPQRNTTTDFINKPGGHGG